MHLTGGVSLNPPSPAPVTSPRHLPPPTCRPTVTCCWTSCRRQHVVRPRRRGRSGLARDDARTTAWNAGLVPLEEYPAGAPGCQPHHGPTSCVADGGTPRGARKVRTWKSSGGARPRRSPDPAEARRSFPGGGAGEDHDVKAEEPHAAARCFLRHWVRGLRRPGGRREGTVHRALTDLVTAEVCREVVIAPASSRGLRSLSCPGRSLTAVRMSIRQLAPSNSTRRVSWFAHVAAGRR